MDDIISSLGLTYHQVRTLFSIQYHITLEDIARESDYSLKARKINWLKSWKEGIEDYLKGLIDEYSNWSMSNLFEYHHFLIDQVKLIQKDGNTLNKLHLILIESVFFEPYFPLGHDEDGHFYGLKHSPEYTDNMLGYLAEMIGIGNTYIKQIKSLAGSAIINYRPAGDANDAIMEEAIKKLTVNFDRALLSVLLTGEPDDKGAVTPGLAALGAGVMACNGLKTMDGKVILCSWLVGEEGYFGISPLFSASYPLLLTQVTKIYVITLEIVLKKQRNFNLARVIIKHLRNSLYCFEESLFLWREGEKMYRDRIDNIAKSIKYLRFIIIICENAYLEEIKSK